MLKRIKEAHWHWESERRPLPDRPSLSPLLCTGSFLSLGINTNASELPLWKQTLLWAQMKMQANPVTHSCLSRTCQLCLLPVWKCPNVSTSQMPKIHDRTSVFYYLGPHAYELIYDKDHATAGGHWQHSAVRPHHTVPRTRMYFPD